MDLTKIEDPSFLKSMSVQELQNLADEIRSFLIQSLSDTGGHIASNLGVIELTIALHYVFDMPRDKLFFDVGHQSYTHKILTGRAAEFKHLRQFGGISGFQRRKESIYDVWEAGHSSTSLSAALGMAVARDLDHQDYDIVPIIGDGALTSGMAMEALNAIGSEQRNMIIIFNDNNMSISKNVGGMTKGFARLRSAKSYNSLKANMKELLNRNEAGKVMFHGLNTIKNVVKNTVIDRGIFGEFNLEYIGPVNGHKIKDLIRVLTVAKDHEGPIVVHVLTTKGKGYAPCENDRTGAWHGVGPFDAESGKLKKSTPPGFVSWSKAIADSVEKLSERNDNLVVLTPAMINGSALNSYFARFPERSFDCGIAEEHTVTMAAGLAISGKRPFVSIYSSFMQRAYDQINHDVCRMDLPVVFGIDRSGLVGEDGSTHHGVFDISMLRPMPHMIITEAKNAEEAHQLLYTALQQKHPFAIRYPRGNVRQAAEYIDRLIPIGSWDTVYEAKDPRMTVITYGTDVERLHEKAVSNELLIRIVNARFLKPIDETLLRQLALEKRPVLIYETDMKTGGLGSAILEFANQAGIMLNLEIMGIEDEYIPHGDVNHLRQAAGISFSSLLDKITDKME